MTLLRELPPVTEQSRIPMLAYNSVRGQSKLAFVLSDGAGYDNKTYRVGG